MINHNKHSLQILKILTIVNYMKLYNKNMLLEILGYRDLIQNSRVVEFKSNRKK